LIAPSIDTVLAQLKTRYYQGIKIVKKNIHERLHRESYFMHPRLKFIPNIVFNLIISVFFAVVVSLLLDRSLFD
jgi:hypothetical protein